MVTTCMHPQIMRPSTDSILNTDRSRLQPVAGMPCGIMPFYRPNKAIGGGTIEPVLPREIMANAYRQSVASGGKDGVVTNGYTDLVRFMGFETESHASEILSKADFKKIPDARLKLCLGLFNVCVQVLVEIGPPRPSNTTSMKMAFDDRK